MYPIKYDLGTKSQSNILEMYSFNPQPLTTWLGEGIIVANSQLLSSMFLYCSVSRCIRSPTPTFSDPVTSIGFGLQLNIHPYILFHLEIRQITEVKDAPISL